MRAFKDKRRYMSTATSFMSRVNCIILEKSTFEFGTFFEFKFFDYYFLFPRDKCLK